MDADVRVVLKSCDTFVALPPATRDNCIVFGKNADRPSDEVQEVVYFPAADHVPSTEKLKCTFLEIDQVVHTEAVVLSKPAWIWGAEMGANQHGVCIGNEAVWTVLGDIDDDGEDRLLPMDLLRLGLERSKTAREALDVIVELLHRHGQRGLWGEHSSYIITDRQQAWVLETADQWWAAERITSGCRNISNELSIRTKFDLIKDGTQEFARRKGFYAPSSGPFDFAAAFSSGPVDDVAHALNCKRRPYGRFLCGRYLMEQLSKTGDFNAESLFSILRDEESDICMNGGIVSAGSQVSVVPIDGCAKPATHWFTATKNPAVSLFKPFFFVGGARTCELTRSPAAPPRGKKRKRVDLKHALYRSHEETFEGNSSNRRKTAEKMKRLRELERESVKTVDELLGNYDKQTDSKQTDSKQTERQQTDNKQTDSKQMDSKQTDSKQTERQQTDNKLACLFEEMIQHLSEEIIYRVIQGWIQRPILKNFSSPKGHFDVQKE
ncbi:secernin-3-like [Tubulanus polymorphus]|uniref:secernin-3-like n=1 Tax=Tubulanus polymorphus TaxID=672921 RepID=UPI003DA51B5F